MSVEIFHMFCQRQQTRKMKKQPQNSRIQHAVLIARNLTEVAGTGGLSPAGVPVAQVAHGTAVIVVVI